MIIDTNFFAMAFVAILGVAFIVAYCIYWMHQSGCLNWLRVQWYLLQWNVRRRIVNLQMAIAWAAPKWLASWCFTRVVSHGTTGKYSSTNVTEVRAVTILNRWEADHE